MIGLDPSDARPTHPSRNPVRRYTANAQYDCGDALQNVADADGETAAIALDKFSTSELRELLELLNRWDREGTYGGEAM